MASTVQIKIYGKTYVVKRTSKQTDLNELARFVDSKMQELSYGAAKTSTIDLAVLTALNIAQELMELKNEINSNREFVEAKTEAMIERLSEVLNEK
ncbi:MAG: cell division protein ZapA [Deltaproteobacteria bacterium]|nr:cell division protein ZapA [Deltaproteobacteria bacterium]